MIKPFFKRTSFLFSILFSLNFFSSCQLFNNSVIEYLEKYSTEIITGDLSFSEYQYDNQNNLCIPSNNDYIINLYISNPANHNFNIQFLKDDNEWVTYSQDSSNSDFSIDNFYTNDCINFTFLNTFLQSKDTEDSSTNRFYTKTFRLQDQTNNRIYDPFNISFTVNNPPDIVSCGVEHTEENKLVLCMNIKNFTTNPIYDDIKPDTNGYYTILIDNTPYKFKFEGSTIKFYDANYNELSDFTTTKDSTQQAIPGFSFYPDSSCKTVYFKTNYAYTSDNPNSTHEFNVQTTDFHGLVYKQNISVHTTGKIKLPKPEIKIISGDTFPSIGPTLNWEDPESGQNISISSVTVNYKIDDGEVITKELGNSTTQYSTIINLKKLSGGKTKIEAWLSKNGYIESDHETFLYTADNTMYVDPYSSEEEGLGGTKDYPVKSLGKALQTIKNKAEQNEEWTIILLNDVTTDDKLEIDDTKIKKLTIKSDTTTNREIKYNGSISCYLLSIKSIPTVELSYLKICNSKSRGLYLTSKDVTISNCEICDNTQNGIFYDNDAQNTKLEIINSSIHDNNKTDSSMINGGGIYTEAKKTIINKSEVYSNQGLNGGGIYSSQNTTLEIINQSKIYSNTVSSSGGGIYSSQNTTLEIINQSKIYSNTVSSSGGGIAISHSQTCTIKDSTIYSNKASLGGGIYVNSTITECSITLNNTIIGTTSSTDGNSAESGGGIYIGSNCTIDFQNNSKISNNSVISTDNGSNIYISNSSSYMLTLKNPTVIANDPNVSSIFQGTKTNNTSLKLSGTINFGSTGYIALNKMDMKDVTSISNTIKFACTTSDSSNTTGFLIVTDILDSLKSKIVCNNDNNIIYSKASSTSGRSNLYYINKTNHVITSTSDSEKSKFQTIIDKASSKQSGEYVIIFTSDITEDSNMSYPKETSSDIYSPAIFNNSNIKYIIYGNGYTYTANRNSTNLGSAIYLSANTNVEIHDLLITGGNAAQGGGAFINTGATLTLNNGVEIFQNYSTQYGGGGLFIENNATVTIKNGVTISHNTSAKEGGAIYCSGKLNIEGAIIYENSSTSGCPGIYFSENSYFNKTTNNYLIMKNNTTSNTSDKIGLDLQFNNTVYLNKPCFTYMNLTSDCSTNNNFVNLYMCPKYYTTWESTSPSQNTNNKLHYLLFSLNTLQNTTLNIKKLGWKTTTNNYYIIENISGIPVDTYYTGNEWN